MAYIDTRIVADNDDTDPPAGPAAATSGPLLNIFAVAGLLGQRRRSTTWIVRYLDQLADQAGFPAPLPLLARAGLIRTAHKDSQWIRDAVEAWLDGQAPAPVAASMDAAALTAAGNRLDSNARRLRLVGGNAA